MSMAKKKDCGTLSWECHIVRLRTSCLFVASLSMRQDSENAKEEQLLILKEDYFANTNPKRTQSQEETLAKCGKNV